MHTKTHFSDDIRELLELANEPLCQYFFEGHTKQAASNLFSRKDLQDLSPPPGQFAIHKVVMGSEEKYGPNRNHDGYPRAGLIKNHPTFVKIALCYREHENKDKRKNLGTIKASRWDPKLERVETVSHVHIDKAPEEYEMAKQGKELSFSQSCFVAGTVVRRADQTGTHIENIQVGDAVITHAGNIGTVSHTMARPYVGAGVELRACGLPEPVVCTIDHGIWVRPSAKGETACPVCGGRFNGLKAHLRQRKDAQHQRAYRDFSRAAEGFRGAGAIKPGDFIRVPFDHTVRDDVSESLAELLGFYVAEGSATLGKTTPYKGNGNRYDRYTLCFTFNDTEREFIARTQELLMLNGWKSYLAEHPDQHRTQVVCCSRQAWHWFVQHGGKYSAGKKLSAAAMQWPPAKQKLIFARWLDGDGTWSRINDTISGVSISRALAEQMVVIAARLGMAANLQKYKHKDKNTAYTVSLSGEEALNSGSAKVPADFEPTRMIDAPIGQLNFQTEGRMTLRKPATRRSFVEGNFIYRAIRTARQVFLDELVYDITVPGDHGFVANGYGVSNCKVPADYCSICDHAAPKPELYCGHLKKSMGRYLPEFQKYAYASNPNPIFFDESFVKYGADRIARYLEYKFADEGHRKAASAEGNIPETISGSDWSDIIGTSKSMTPLDIGARALLTKLASLERQYAAQCQAGIKFAAASYGYGASFDGDSSITDQDIQALRKLSPGTFFRKAASAGVILPFDVFCAYVQDRKLADIREDASLKSAAATLPAAFSVLDKMGDEDSEHNGCCQEDVDMFSAGSSFGADCDPAATNEIDQIMDKVTADFSTADQPTADRCVAVVVEKSAAVRAEFRKSAAAVRPENITLDPMVELYASYKIAAIRDIRELCPQCSSNASPEEFAVAQNFRFS